MSELPTPLDAMVQGSRAEALTALRRLQAEALIMVEPDKVPAAAKELKATLLELDSLPDAKQASPSDVLAARRQDRLSTPPGAAPAERGAV